MNMLSFGGGVQTSYLLFKHWERYKDGAIVFADVGAGDRQHAEKDITYWLIDNMVKPFCEEKGLNFAIRSKDISLWDHCVKEKIIPTRQFRWCTDKWKKQIIKKYMRKELRADRKTNIIHQDIGFTIDEAHRMRLDYKEPKYLKSEYPLIDWKVSRQDCLDWLNEHKPIMMNGNKIDWNTAKSGCWFCMFAKKQELLELNDWQKKEVIAFEKNGYRYPEITLHNISMEDFYNKQNRNHKMEDFDSCNSGHCFL